MKIGIIGTGNMGRAIGVRFARLGHEVVFGARTADGAQEAVRLAGGGAASATNDGAARHGDVLIWTIREPDPAKVLSDLGALDGKVVVNVNNRDYENGAQTGAWFTESIAEAFQARAPRARVVKALNVVGMETLDTSPEALRGAGAQVFTAGDDADAKAVVSGLLAELGFEAVDIGAGAAAFRAAEALGDVIRLLMIGAKRGGRVNLQLRPLPAPDLGQIGARTDSAYT